MNFSDGWIFEWGQMCREEGKTIKDNPYPWWCFSERSDWRKGWKAMDKYIKDKGTV